VHSYVRTYVCAYAASGREDGNFRIHLIVCLCIREQSRAEHIAEQGRQEKPFSDRPHPERANSSITLVSSLHAQERRIDRQTGKRSIDRSIDQAEAHSSFQVQFDGRGNGRVGYADLQASKKHGRQTDKKQTDGYADNGPDLPDRCMRWQGEPWAWAYGHCIQVGQCVMRAHWYVYTHTHTQTHTHSFASSDFAQFIKGL
jgi:hypothetical protein